MAIATINPATGQTVQTFIAHSQVEVNAKLDLAQETFQSFRHLPFAQRGQWLRKAADILEQRRDEWAALMTLEMGKSIPQAIAQLDFLDCHWRGFKRTLGRSPPPELPRCKSRTDRTMGND